MPETRTPWRHLVGTICIAGWDTETGLCTCTDQPVIHEAAWQQIAAALAGCWRWDSFLQQHVCKNCGAGRPAHFMTAAGPCWAGELLRQLNPRDLPVPDVREDTGGGDAARADGSS